MKIKKLSRIVLSLLFVFWCTSVSAANVIKWSMQGDSLTLDPHAQNEGPTTMVSRQIYDCLLYTSPSPRDLSTSRMPSSA